jgi:trk system potassium uptake protein TrkA
MTPVVGGRNKLDRAVLVCGLGRFGSSTAAALAGLERDVLAVDRNPRIVQEWSGRLARVVEADSTSLDALRELGVQGFAHAVVGIGSSVESSVLTCANLVDLGVQRVWAKAVSPAHGRILERIGVHHVIQPEAEAGSRMAHRVAGNLVDFLEFEDGFAIVKMRPPQETQGFTLAESQVRTKYGVTVVGVKSPGEDFTYAVPTTRVTSHDLLVVSGRTALIEKFAARP